MDTLAVWSQETEKLNKNEEQIRLAFLKDKFERKGTSAMSLGIPETNPPTYIEQIQTVLKALEKLDLNGDGDLAKLYQKAKTQTDNPPNIETVIAMVTLKKQAGSLKYYNDSKSKGKKYDEFLKSYTTENVKVSLNRTGISWTEGDLSDESINQCFEELVNASKFNTSKNNHMIPTQEQVFQYFVSKKPTKGLYNRWSAGTGAGKTALMTMMQSMNKSNVHLFSPIPGFENKMEQKTTKFLQAVQESTTTESPDALETRSNQGTIAFIFDERHTFSDSEQTKKLYKKLV
jgi:hypothetical protein